MCRSNILKAGRFRKLYSAVLSLLNSEDIFGIACNSRPSLKSLVFPEGLAAVCILEGTGSARSTEDQCFFTSQKARTEAKPASNTSPKYNHNLSKHKPKSPQITSRKLPGTEKLRLKILRTLQHGGMAIKTNPGTLLEASGTEQQFS